MRISNIKDYLGGADNVIARELNEGDQFKFKFTVGTPNEDLTNYTFDVHTQLFNGEITQVGSNATIDRLELATLDLNNNGHMVYPNAVTLDPTDSTKAELLIPTTLLSDLTNLNAAPNTTTPFIVAMGIRINDGATVPNIRSFRVLFIVRYLA